MRAFALISCLVASSAFATTYVVNPEESFFGVVTWKDGLAAKLAHNHLIVAKGVEATLSFDASKPALAVFEAKIPVEKLVIDAPAAQTKWSPVLEQLGVLAVLTALTDKEQKAVRESMLGSDQLNVEKYPFITAKLSGLEAKETVLGDRGFSHIGKLEVTIHNQTVSREAPVSLKLKDGGIEAESLARFEFSQFGIKPYSAFLCAVKVKNEFAVYVKVAAK